jgi:hypothetical protein
VQRLIAIIFFFPAFCAFAQECFIDESFSPEQFRGHKIKSIKVSVIPKDSASGRHAFTYEMAANNRFTKGIRYSAQGYLETSCTWSKDSTRYVMTTNSIDVQNNLVLPVKRITREYNKKHQLLMHSIEELMGNYSSHITRFNPDDVDETCIESIGMQGHDTVGYSLNKQNHKGFLMISRERKNGQLLVRKQVVIYRDSLVEQFDEYENGKLISSRKGNPGEYAILRKRVDPESKNSLPYTVFVYTDTLIIDIAEVPVAYKACLKNIDEKKLKKIVKYFRPNKQDVYGTDYLYMNGLPLISHALALNEFNFYEYEFYKDEPKKPVKKTVKANGKSPAKTNQKTPGKK